MSDNNLKSTASKEETDQIESLLSALKRVEKNIEIAIDANVSFTTIVEYEKSYRVIAKRINALYAKFGIGDKVKEAYKSDLERTRKHFAYRDKKDESEISEKKDPDTFDTNTFSLGTLGQGTPIVPGRIKCDIPSLDLGKLNLDDLTLTPFASNTPRTVETRNFRPVKFDTPKDCFNYIKQEITEEIPPAYVETFLEDKENFTDLVKTVTRGFQLPYIYQIVRNKIFGFVQKREEELVNQTRDETPLLTALDNLPEDTVTKIMANNLNMRGLSVRDALDLIPRYNGANIPLSQFLDGCTEAKSILPAGVEEDFTKFIRIRLYGEALNIARSQSFATLKDLADFFEKMFGSAKTYYDLTGELAKVRQGEKESVVVYLNKLTELEKEIRRSAQKEGRVRDETTFTEELNRDCLRFFMRGLKWEIKACMGTPESYHQAQEKAIETERELACNLFDRGK